MTLIEPQSEKHFEAYFLLRWKELRKPWKQVWGSERDEMEASCIHAMIIDKKEEALAVGRLQFNSSKEGQIRFMAVKKEFQGQGLGKKIVAYLEGKAKEKGAKTIILHARENAIPFYEKMNYQLIKKSYLLYNEIQHYLMSKNIS